MIPTNCLLWQHGGVRVCAFLMGTRTATLPTPGMCDHALDNDVGKVSDGRREGLGWSEESMREADKGDARPGKRFAPSSSINIIVSFKPTRCPRKYSINRFCSRH